MPLNFLIKWKTSICKFKIPEKIQARKIKKKICSCKNNDTGGGDGQGQGVGVGVVGAVGGVVEREGKIKGKIEAVRKITFRGTRTSSMDNIFNVLDPILA